VVRAGFQALEFVAKKLNARTAWLVCDGHDNLGGFITEVIGDAKVKALQQGKAIPFSSDCVLEFYSNRTLPHSGSQNPVLACFPSKNLLDKVDGLTGVTTLIVLPWSQQDIDPWLVAHGAREILGRINSQPAIVSNSVVAKALEDIHARINVSTGVVHSSDKHAVVEAFRILRDGGEPVDPTEVRAWFVQKGMEPKHANVIAEIASEPGKFRLSETTPSWRPEILSRWRSAKD